MTISRGVDSLSKFEEGLDVQNWLAKPLDNVRAVMRATRGRLASGEREGCPRVGSGLEAGALEPHG